MTANLYDYNGHAARERRRRAIGTWAAVIGIVALAAILAAAFYMAGG